MQIDLKISPRDFSGTSDSRTKRLFNRLQTAILRAFKNLQRKVKLTFFIFLKWNDTFLSTPFDAFFNSPRKSIEVLGSKNN